MFVHFFPEVLHRAKCTVALKFYEVENNKYSVSIITLHTFVLITQNAILNFLIPICVQLP